MHDEFAPHYIKFFREPNPRHPSMPWWAWGLINILSLATMYALLSVLPTAIGDFALVIAGLFILAPVFAAGVIDGHVRIAVVLTFSAWLVLFASLGALMLTEAWRRDCGLGQGFTIYFTILGAAVYPLVMAPTFALGRGLERRLRR